MRGCFPRFAEKGKKMKNYAIKDEFKGLFVGIFAVLLSVVLAGCGGAAQEATTNAEASATTDASTVRDADDSSDETIEDDDDELGSDDEGDSSDELEDGTYDIEVETDSSMFRADSCTLTVKDGVYTATLSLPGEGFSRLYYGTAEDAATADDADIADYYLNDDGLYTFDLTVEALDEELPIAAYGQRRDTWYDHRIMFLSPDDE